MATKYLSVNEYLSRFGEAEAVRLTSENPASPARNDAMIENAILDAEQVADGYIARRYPVPVVDPQPVLKTWVASLARELLHKTKAPQAVTDMADKARAQLKEVSIGLFKLIGAEGVAAVSSADDNSAMTSGDDSALRFDRGALADFGDLGGNASTYRAWRDN